MTMFTKLNSRSACTDCSIIIFISTYWPLKSNNDAVDDAPSDGAVLDLVGPAQ